MTSWTYDRLNRLVTQQPGGLLPVVGTVNEPATVRVQGQLAPVDPAGTFAGGVQVAPGTTRFAITATDASGNSTTHSYDVDQTGASKTFTFDANGNMTSDGMRTFEWDARNQLLAVRNGATPVAEFAYNGAGQRVATIAAGITRTAILDRKQMVAEQVGTMRVTYADAAVDHHLGWTDQNGSMRFVASDHLESTDAITLTDGSVDERYAYDPWGYIAAGAELRGYRFNGRQWESDVSLYYYRARYYDSATGRFLSEDPVGDSLHLSLYSYASNNPITNTDPTGWHSVYYDGDMVRVFDDDHHLALRCRGTSGRPGTTPQDQREAGAGPIPRGRYLVYPEEFSGGPGLRTTIRNFLGNWGTWRVPLHPIIGTNTYGRDGFFFHGGERPGSAGCINLQRCDTQFHDLLANHDGPVPVTVNYVGYRPF